ncbi:MAG: hypothetical protein IPJ77_01420 [Planctomycetes bacterium]|nr:hypothetical protein [Planctomycetota bacterium]
MNRQELVQVAKQLREKINDELNVMLQARITAGKFDETYQEDDKSARGELKPAGVRPQGLGRTHQVSTHDPISGGGFITRTSYITEAEHPDFFARKDELRWVDAKAYRMGEEMRKALYPDPSFYPPDPNHDPK